MVCPSSGQTAARQKYVFLGLGPSPPLRAAGESFRPEGLALLPVPAPIRTTPGVAGVGSPRISYKLFPYTRGTSSVPLTTSLRLL